MTGNRALNTNVDFQKEERAKKLNLQQARIGNKRSNYDTLSQKIFDKEVRQETQYHNKLSQKAALSDLYEKLCHLQ